MKSTVSRITCGAFAVAMLVGVSACVQLFDHSPDVKIRPVSNMQGRNASSDSEYYLSAVSAISSRDYASALEYLQAARAKEPENVKILNAFGVVYDKLGRFDLSARYYAQASALDPKSIIVAKNIAYSKALQGISTPDASQLASVETPSMATVRVADAHAVPGSPVPTPAAPSTSPLHTPTGVAVIAQRSTSDVPARSSAAAAAVVSPNPVTTIVPASVPSWQSGAPNGAPFAKAAIPVASNSALSTPISATPVVINKIAAARVKTDASETPISPVMRKATVIAKSSTPNLAAPPSAPRVAVAPVKPVASVVPASLASPRPVAKVAATTAKAVALDISATVRPAHSAIVPAVTIKPAASAKADVLAARISPAATRVMEIAKSSAPDLPARSSAATIAIVPPKLAASTGPVSPSLPRSAPPIAASIVKTAAPASLTSARPTYPSVAPVIVINAVARPRTDTPKTVLLTGYPLIVTNASGAMDTVQLVRHNLAMLGWTISRASAPNIRSQHDSIVFYPPANIAAAHALARTLPFPVRMAVNQCHCGGLQLLVGSDVLGWKNVHRYNPSIRPKALSVAAISNTTRMGVQ